MKQGTTTAVLKPLTLYASLWSRGRQAATDNPLGARQRYVLALSRLSFLRRWQEVDNAHLLVAAVGVEEEELRRILADVEGEACGLEELGQGLGAAGAAQSGNGRDRWKKMYKITEEELSMSSLEDCVLMRMAVKDH